MTWLRIQPAPTVTVSPADVKAALIASGKTVRQANGLMYQAKREARACKLIPPVLRIGGELPVEFLWRDGRGRRLQA